jgi:phage terminase large subunit
MNIESQIHLNKFQPRRYQLPIFDAIENKGYKRVLCILPRRAGKDVMAFNLLLRAALRQVGNYFYIFPTYSQARKVIWQGIMNDGRRFLDFIPPDLIEAENSSEMQIRLVNGSIMQLIGSDNYDALMGTNARGIIFSEYALQDPIAWQYLRPILVANNGFALFLSTPRGHNHLWELYQIASQSKDWFVQKLTIDDTQHIPLFEIEKEKMSGEISEDLIQQEYYCSFSAGIEGSYYSKYIDKMRLDNRICYVGYEVGFPTHTVWDIGVRDSTCIIFFQTIGQSVRIIDVYENAKVGLEHYIKVIKQKDYIFGYHFAPHDIKVMEFGSGRTRIEKARSLGIDFKIAPEVSIEDGIECVRSNLSKIWIDENKCKPLIRALENYRQEYDVKHKVYRPKPLHDWSSHWADAMRYLCLSLPRTNMRHLDTDKLFEQAVNPQGQLPKFYRDEL